MKVSQRDLTGFFGSISGDTPQLQGDLSEVIAPVALGDDASMSMPFIGGPRFISMAVTPTLAANYSQLLVGCNRDGAGLWISRLRVESGNGQISAVGDYDGLLATYFAFTTTTPGWQGNGSYPGRNLSIDALDGVPNRYVRAAVGYGPVLVGGNVLFVIGGLEVIQPGAPMWVPPGQGVLIQANVANTARTMIVAGELALPIGPTAEVIVGPPRWK